MSSIFNKGPHIHTWKNANTVYMMANMSVWRTPIELYNKDVVDLYYERLIFKESGLVSTFHTHEKSATS